MSTNHKIFFEDSRNLSFLEENSVNLTITSPPYPMIQMWDNLFSKDYNNQKTEEALLSEKGNVAFELMHQELDKVWTHLFRITKQGGFVVINIGDATRKIGGNFQLYSNHTRVTSKFIELGFDVLPMIVWKKTSNSPNKFMGSGMLPAGAYITLEQEYILIFRKGSKRNFTEQQKINRKESAFFWEERNVWFSNIWDLKGVRQDLLNNLLRKRSAAYSIELPYRIINMYSCKNDLVFDPFLGTGTTIFASALLERNTIGVEIDSNFSKIIQNGFNNLLNQSMEMCDNRIKNHINFIEKYQSLNKKIKHNNIHYNFPVITSQEKQIQINKISKINFIDNQNINIDYEFFKPQ